MTEYIVVDNIKLVYIFIYAIIIYYQLAFKILSGIWSIQVGMRLCQSEVYLFSFYECLEPL